MRDDHTNTIICAQTDSSFEIIENARAFGYQVWCNRGDDYQCSNTNGLEQRYFASIISNTAANITWNGKGTEFVGQNSYLSENATSVFNFSQSEFEQSNFPSQDVGQLACFMGINIHVNPVHLNTTFDLGNRNVWDRRSVTLYQDGRFDADQVSI
mmetsp:Transcript_22828/g.25376  ORF Transcript_22828/g.25376 Transcript_22828/m.25376 type:complete len:155 (+) Transcript_22828:1-465(+)